MIVCGYQGWVIWVYACGNGYSMQCLSPDLEIYTDWEIHPSLEVAMRAAKDLIEQDEEPDARSGLYTLVGLMSQWESSETVKQESFATLECQRLGIEVGGMDGAMLGIVVYFAYLLYRTWLNLPKVHHSTRSNF